MVQAQKAQPVCLAPSCHPFDDHPEFQECQVLSVLWPTSDSAESWAYWESPWSPQYFDNDCGGTLSILHLRDLWSARIRRKNMGCCYSVVRPSLSNHLMSIRFLPVWSVSKRPSKHESSMRFCPHLYRHLTWKAHPARQREPGIMRPWGTVTALTVESKDFVLGIWFGLWPCHGLSATCLNKLELSRLSALGVDFHFQCLPDACMRHCSCL